MKKRFFVGALSKGSYSLGLNPQTAAMTSFRRLCVLFLVFFFALAPLRAVDWVSTQRVGEVLHFFVSSPASVERYDLSSRTWLSPVVLPGARGVLTAATVDGDGLFVAYGAAVYRYGVSGGAEQHVLTATDTVQSLFTDGNLLLVNHTVGLYARVRSVNKATNTQIASFEKYLSPLFGASISRETNRLFGVVKALSPADVTYVEYRDDGTFVGGGDSPHHDAYSIGDRTWTLPGGDRFVDSAGHVYISANLNHALVFPTAITDLDFVESDVPIVLSTNVLTAYTNTLLPAGSRTLAQAGKTIAVSGDEVLVFRPLVGAGIGIEFVLLDDLNAPTPGSPASPEGLPFVPDEAFVDDVGVLHLLSKAHETIFRWDPASQAFLPGIPLLGTPDFIAYSAVNDCVYTAYPSGLIRRIDLGVAPWVEVPFAQLPSAPRGLATADGYVFAVDRENSFEIQRTYAPGGALVDSAGFNDYSRHYVWSSANQRMYFLRDDVSPNDLHWRQVNADGIAYPALAPGALGLKMESPLHTITGFAHPIRVSPDGTLVVLGSGVIHDGLTLARLSSALANSFTDGAWGTDGFYSVRVDTGATQFQQWLAPTFGVGTTRRVPGTPRHLLALPGARLLGLTNAADGLPSFYVLNQQLQVLAPPTLAAPAGPTATVATATRVDLTWTDISGETAYTVERRLLPAGPWTTLGSTSISVTTFADNTPIVGNTYAYRITAANGALASAPSPEAQIVFDVPARPTLTGTVLGASQIKLDWTAPARATGYVLERRLGAAGAWSAIATLGAAAISHTDGTVASNTTYSYRLVATNLLGSSPASDLVTLTTPQIPPSAPTLGFISGAGHSSVPLSWTSAARVETYRIERAFTATGPWAAVATLTAPASNHIDLTVSPSTAYVYRIVALNSVGSATSNTRFVTTPQLPQPTAPTALEAAVLSATEIRLTWTDATDESSYRVERRVGEDAWSTVATLAANTVTVTDTTVSVGVFYTYRVIAVNTRGETASAELTVQAAAIGVIARDDFDPDIDYPVWSELSGATALTGPTGFHSGKALWMGGAGLRSVALAPLDLSLGGSLRFLVRAGNSAVDGITHWDNSETGETLQVQYALAGGAWQTFATINTVFPNHSAWTAYDLTVPVAARSTATRFRWVQLQHSGANFDTWALDNVEVTGALPALPGTVPFITGSANSSRAVALSWIGAERAATYAIERRTPSTAWTVIGTTGAAQTFYTDNAALPATPYSYRVTARNVSGDGAPSDYILITTWSTLAEWRFQNYGTLAPTGAAASLAENGTGVPNLFKFAFNMAAEDRFFTVESTGGVKGMPSLQFESETGRLQIAFMRRRAERSPGITYVVEFSSNLVDWGSAGAEVVAAPVNEDFEYVVWEDDAPVDATTRPTRFARVRVSE
jgi:fibronectin type 3 domain-containing protein